MYPQQIIEALAHVRYPGTGKNIVESGILEDDIRIHGMTVTFSLIFEKDSDPFIRSVVKAAETAVKTYIDPNITVSVHPKFNKVNPAQGSTTLPWSAKQIIAIHSGKGGVGKSTVAANLAVALAQQGKRVALLDADIHGPSQTKMFHVEDSRPISVEYQGRELIQPIEQYGIKLLSIGFFVDPDNAIVWRGGMASNAIKQLIEETAWGESDFFLIDLPPGTSDIHLTLIQEVALTGVIVVTTPQPVALVDARKGVDMFRHEKVNVPILGLIENMAYFTPAELPENKYYIFGRDGGKSLATELDIPFLGQIPLVQSIRESGDNGLPIAIQTGHPAAQFFNEIAKKLIDNG